MLTFAATALLNSPNSEHSGLGEAQLDMLRYALAYGNGVLGQSCKFNICKITSQM